MKRAILPLALVLLPVCLPAQEISCLRRTLPVSVVGADEVPVGGMTAENFRSNFQGATVRILSASWSAGPRRTVVLLDLSGSMTENHDYSLHNKRKALAALLDDVLLSGQGDSEFALLTFADKVEQITPLTRNRRPALDWVDKVTSDSREIFKGRTALVDAIDKAVEVLSPPRLGDSIYLISDGGENGSRSEAGKIEEKLGSAGVRLFAFFVVDPDPRLRFVEDNSERIVEMIRRTGGMGFVLRSPKLSLGGEYDLRPEGRQNLWAVANSLFQQMEKFYALEIELPRIVDKPRPWKLELIPRSSPQVKGLRLHAPTKLFPCTTTK